ncbi:MAG: hypothetical protein OXT09_23480 [Myxococcales bacterium]|nr:hypothetical protein [Myxococcales bacterium]
MTAVLAFWLALWIPGHALQRRLAPSEADAGLFPSAATSYLYIFAALTPIALAGYLFGLPIEVLVAAVLVAVVWGCVELARNLVRPSRPGPLVIAFLSLAGLLIGADLVLGTLAGTFLSGDTFFHVARIRMMADHGFNNLDPYIAEPAFGRIYHTNLYHALLAACSTLTGMDPIAAWSATLIWAKLIIGAGAAYLSYTVFRSRPIALLSALLIMLWQGPVTFANYPNRVAGWPIALCLAFAVQWWREPERLQPPLKLCAAVLILAQLHALYALIAALALGPVMVVRWLSRGRRSRRAALVGAVAVGALTLSVPFLLVTKYVDVPDRGAAKASKPGKKKKPVREHASGFVFDADGTYYSDPAKWWRLKGFYPWLLVALIITMAARKEVAVLAGAVATTALLMHVPLLCMTLADLLGGRPWAVGRLGSVHHQAFFGLAPGVLLWRLPERFEGRWIGLPVLAAVAALGLQARWTGSDWGWPVYLEKARAGLEQPALELRELQAQAEFLRKHVPAGSTVLAPATIANVIVMLHDCYVIAGDQGSPGVRGMAKRRKDLRAALRRSTSPEKRSRLLKKYDVHHAVTRPSRNHIPTILKGQIAEDVRGPGLRVLRIDH